MPHEFSRTKIRKSKKALAALPENVADVIRNSRAASFTYVTVSPDYRFYAGEGERITLVYGDKALRQEMVAEHNVGASNMNYAIGTRFTAPEGAFVIVSGLFLGSWFLYVYNVQAHRVSVEGA